MWIFSDEVVDVSNKRFAGMVGGVITVCSVAVLADSKYSFLSSPYCRGFSALHTKEIATV